MAKSLRSKKKKRLRTLRREIAEPFYDEKDAAKLAAQEAALAAPKLPVRGPPTADEPSTGMGERALTHTLSLYISLSLSSYIWLIFLVSRNLRVIPWLFGLLFLWVLRICSLNELE